MIFKRKQSSLIIGLDISSSDTGVAVALDGKLVWSDHFKRPEYGDYISLLRVADDIVDALTARYDRWAWRDGLQYKNIMVFPEDIFMGKNAHGMIVPLIMQGILLTKLNAWANPQADYFHWNSVSVGTWRSWLLKKAGVKADSRKSKDQKLATLEAVKVLNLAGAYGRTVSNENEADGIGICAWAVENAKEEV